MKGRALTPAQKRAVIERILAAWEKVPELRLGQMLLVAVQNGDISRPVAVNFFATEDERLADCAEAYAKETAK